MYKPELLSQKSVCHLLVRALGLVALLCTSLARATPDLTDYELVFSDEFEGSTLDSSKWNSSFFWGPFQPINAEEQYYVDALNLDSSFGYSPFSLSGGILTIEAVPTSPVLSAPDQPAETDSFWDSSPDLIYNQYYDPDTRNYLSGILTSAQSYNPTHGYFEARLKFPEGQGLWPAFWLLNNKYVENLPEIDIVEFLGHKKNTVHHTLHYMDIADGWRTISSPTYETTGPDYTADFHTYGLAWDPKKIRFYVDGEMVKEITDSDFLISTQSMYILLNLAVGGSWPSSPDSTTSFPAKYEIDYVRAYERKSIPTITPQVLADEYQLMFSDEFNGTDLDAGKWNTSYLWGPYYNINNEGQIYIDRHGMHNDHSVNPFELSAGTLKIRAEDIAEADLPVMPPEGDSAWDSGSHSYRRDTNYLATDGWTPEYSSGLLTSYDSFKFVNGYAEARIKMPTGSGLWPAFWLLNGYYVGPMPEMDIVEAQGEVPNVTHHSYHYFNSSGQQISGADTYNLVGSDISDFHVYGFQWDTERMVWYVDGIPVREVTGPQVSKQVSYVLLNLAVGGNFVGEVDNNAIPAEMEVDWVRVWQLDSVEDLPTVEPEPEYTLVDGGGVGVNEPVLLEQESATHWTNLTFKDNFDEVPVVITSVLSSNDLEPGVTGVSSVTAESVDVQIDEWDYLDGAHGSESISLMMLEPGQHDLGGLQAEAGVESSVGSTWSSVSFDTPFDSVPVVLAQVINSKGEVAATVRLKSVSATGFTVRIQGEQSGGLLAGIRQVHYIAIEQGDGKYAGGDIRVGLANAAVNHTIFTLNFGDSFINPQFYAADQSSYGWDTGSLRMSSLTEKSVDLVLTEEQSGDSEVTHNRESVGWVLTGERQEVAGPEYTLVDGGEVGVNELVLLEQESATHWTNLTFKDNFDEAPVVIASVLSSNDLEPSVVGMSSVTAESVDVQIDEWDYLDGVHGSESISLMMLEPGQHDLGGLQAEAGVESSVGSTWSGVSFDTPFDSVPVVLAQVINSKGEAAATVRLKSVSATGFTVRIQGEQSAGLLAGARQVHYIAIEQGDGEYAGSDIRVGLANAAVNHTVFTLNFGDSFSNPQFYAADQSSYGWDTASLRMSGLTDGSVDLVLSEEQSGDSEVTHNRESVGWVLTGERQEVTAPEYTLVDGGEVGVNEPVLLEQESATHWTNLTFKDNFAEAPVVITSVLSSNDLEPGVIGVSSVTAESVDVQIDEWDYLDGTHGSESISLMMLEPGQHDLGGLQAEAGVEASVGSTWSSVSFDTPFDGVPVVLAQVINSKGEAAATVRLKSVSATGFAVRIQGEQAAGLLAGERQVHYIAIEQGDGEYAGSDIRVGLANAAVNHTVFTLNFGDSFSNPQFYAADQSSYGWDTASLRMSGLTNESVDLVLSEEQSGDLEVTHSFENLGWVVWQAQGGD